MISVYSYDKICKLIDLFVNNQVITLKIYLDKSLGADNARYVMDFKTYEDYPEEERVEIRSHFNEKTLPLLIHATDALNEFVTMMETDNVNAFEMNFDITTKDFSYARNYKKSLEEIVQPTISETYHNFINDFERFIMHTSIHRMNVPELFMKNPNSSAKRGSNKYVPITFGQLICKLKDVIIDDGEDGVL